MPDTPPSAITEKLKIVIILVLAISLVVMLYRAFSTSGDSQTNTPPASPTTSQQVPLTTLTTLPKHTSKNPPRYWPNQTLAEILKHDPFSTMTQKLVGGNQPPTAAREESALAGQTEQRDSPTVPWFTNKIPEMVFHSRHGTVAVIDSQIVREGEILPNGTRVVEIRPDGIVLERPDAG